IGITQIFNEGVKKIEIGILGFKVMFFYTFLAVLAFAYTQGEEQLKVFLRRIVYFSIPLCFFGFFQFRADPNFMVNQFGRGFERAVMMAHIDNQVDSFLRVFSTFASSGQYASFLVINGAFILGLMFSAKRPSEKVFMGICLAINTMSILTTGSRGSAVLMVAVIFVFMVLCKRVAKQVFIILLLAGILQFAFNFFGRGVISRFESLKDTDMLKDRTMRTTQGMFDEYLVQYPLGRGMGTASGASRYLQTEVAGEELAFIENYPTKLLYETGIFGVIFCYMVIVLLAKRIWRFAFRIARARGDALFAALASYCLVLFAYSLFFVYDPPPAGLFLWAIIGMVAKLMNLSKNEPQQSYGGQPTI
ncbi:MAG: hypothetical protein KBA46_02740, partial [Candidatus Omnitrophica bacterium]|nr:hypothetical protein [Candidatus Omnitrophota bacterium]